MRREIVRAEIRFCLDDAPNAVAVDQIFPEQFTRDDDRVAGVEFASQFAHRRMLPDRARFASTMTPQDYLAKNRARFLDELKTLVSFPSVSAQPDHNRDTLACANWVAKHFRSIGLDTTLHKTAGHPI